MEFIEHVFYINLDSRTDRRGEIEEEFRRIGISGERFSAIKATPGTVGCNKSHLAVLKIARDRRLKNVLIFEDDFQFTVSKEVFWKSIEKFFLTFPDFDVLMLSHNTAIPTSRHGIISKVHNAQTTSGYIVNACFYDTLIDNWNNPDTGNLDIKWKILQPNNKWYALVPSVGIQRPSYSDIECKNVAYGC